MEAAPPSYETATLINPWDLVAEWLPSNDLCSAASVCSAWHSVFTPHLWGNPAAHFGTENDRVYIALTKFQRTLPWARRYVRAFTHTLHLPPASAEIYYGPHDGWLRDVLERLENLQTLIVRGLPFFDHGALTALRPKPNQDGALSKSQGFALRLLDASKCENTTTSGLLAALKRLDQLLYLDLSFTYPAKDRQVLAQLSNFAGLQVLKLRGISLKDDDVQVLAKAIGTRVRSLDLRNNKLTDQSARHLAESCFTNYELNDTDAAQRTADGERASLLHYLGASMLQIYQGEGFEGYLRHSLSARFVARLAFEDTPESGVTHLYVADNSLSVEGVSGLLRTCRLHVLDARVDTRLPNKLVHTGGDFEIVYPGAEKLPLTLSKDYGATLTYLKIDHEIITKKPPDYHPDTAIPGRVELADTAVDDDAPPDLPPRHFELEDTSFAPELPPDNTLSELAGTDPRIPLPLRTKKADSGTSSPAADPPVKRGSIFAPEPVSSLSEIPSSPSLSVPSDYNTLSTVSSLSRDMSSYPTYSSSPSASTLGPHNPMLSPQPGTNPFRPPTSQPSTTSKPRSYSALHSSRRARRLALDRTTYHPSTTPHLRTLVLSSFPSHSPDDTTIKRFIAFLTFCASEALLASQLSEADYSLPPSRRSPAHRREAARRIFALETVILEVVPTTPGRRQSKGWKGKSMTDDRDSADLWRTAESDFSFFGEEGETLFPSIEDRRGMWGEGMEVVGSGMGPSAPPTKGKEVAKKEWIDNIAELGKWRREKKAAWERTVQSAKAMGKAEDEVEVEGYWPGAVRVVRLSGREDDDGAGEERDYYGNVCSRTGVYR